MSEMKGLKFLDARRFSVVGFSFFSVYILSFLFEGRVLYGLLDLHGIDVPGYILASVIAHFIGLLTCGLFIKSYASAKNMALGSIGLCLITAIPFFLTPSVLWAGSLIIGGYTGGCTIAAWGYFLRAFTPKDERIKSCADVLIYSNLLMIAVNVVAMNRSPFIGLSFSVLCLVLGMFFIWLLPPELENEGSETLKDKALDSIKNPLLLLCFFIFIITINSGLMYQVINPAFKHLVKLTGWYWAVPYIAALIIMRNLSTGEKRSGILYVGIIMIIGAFIGFMLLGRDTLDYLVVDTLMLGACGIFDLFWWSILGEMLDYTDNPAKLFGVGLSANVLGVLCGDVLGMAITYIGLPDTEVAVIALTVMCATLVILPSLNRQLVLLLKSHVYLIAYDNMGKSQQPDVFHRVKTLDPLTAREHEVLELILSGKSNREIAEVLFISENTVKTHARNIFSKYDVKSRAELISILLRSQVNE